MKPHDLKPPPGSHKRRKRVGRGEGSGKGKTAGRGTKGTRARGEIAPFFEGGQMPLTRRVPKLKGFKPPHPIVYTAVNVEDLARVDATDIGPAEMRSAGLIRGSRGVRVKVLGNGAVDRKLRVRAHAFSTAARSKIEGAGGGVEVIDGGRGRRESRA
jgi:large subunit ribosomal protein L15